MVIFHGEEIFHAQKMKILVCASQDHKGTSAEKHQNGPTHVPKRKDYFNQVSQHQAAPRKRCDNLTTNRRAFLS